MDMCQLRVEAKLECIKDEDNLHLKTYCVLVPDLPTVSLDPHGWRCYCNFHFTHRETSLGSEATSGTEWSWDSRLGCGSLRQIFTQQGFLSSMGQRLPEVK